MPRYRFSEFTLSPRRRVLVRNGHEVPLIPRYFDLLVFLIERRSEAVHRREIFERIWSDVIVSDSALSQAIRTIRRVLGDDSREPRFVRTVSRHGYRFVFSEVIEEEDADWQDQQPSAPARAAHVETVADPFEPLLQLITGANATSNDDEDQREAAELLHALGTAEAMKRLGTRPGHTFARALLRDTRWDVAESGNVPILSQPAPLATIAELVRLRMRRAAAFAAARWANASAGGGLAGVVAGAVGAVLLAAAPSSNASLDLVPVLALIGGVCGAAGGAGVGAGLSVAESIARSRRLIALVSGAAVGGGIAGFIAQWLSRWSLATLVGVNVETGGGLEGLVIGAAAGLGYSLSTLRAEGGLAAPRGRERLRAVSITALSCGLAALMLTLAGRPLVGGTIHAIAEASLGSQAALTPIARLVGEPDFGPLTAAVIGTGEGALFGIGLSLGLTRRGRTSGIASN
jgi:DNA-binding winged helix-turn-helix (wHTH) protein